MIASLRHLRIVLAVAQTRSMTEAAALCHVTQPAVSIALAHLETALGTRIFDRGAGRVASPTAAGQALALRLTRAFAILDPALADLAPRLVLTATAARLKTLIAVVETESFSAAARTLGVAQPTVHRAICQLEQEAGQTLFERRPQGVVAVRAARALATAARLAFAECDQAAADIGDLAGREVGRIVIGAMPLARSVLLGPSIAAFRLRHKTLPVRIVEGPYADLVLGLRRGEVDVLIGALRPEMDDLDQTRLFDDQMTIVARPGHALCQTAPPSLADLAAQSWVVAPGGTPARHHFEAMFRRSDQPVPASLVETGSMVLLRDLLERTDHLGFVSALQVAGDLRAGRLARLGFHPQGTTRPIGLTLRKRWHPTRAQAEMIAILTETGKGARA